MTTTIAKRPNGAPSSTFGSVVDNLFQNSLRRFFDDNWDLNPSFTTGSVPVNVREMDDHYEMDVIAPGVRKQDFNLQVEDNILTVSLNNLENQQGGEKKAKWVRNEYLPKAFSRSFSLDETVDVNKINATYSDGILHLLLPKNEKAKQMSRKIEIQ